MASAPAHKSENGDSEGLVLLSGGLNFLFWNLKRPRADIVAGLAKRHDTDILMLAECPLAPALVLDALNADGPRYFFVNSECCKMGLYTRFVPDYVKPITEGNDYSIRTVAIPDYPEFTLCMVHFPSKQYRTAADQTAFAADFSSKVLEPVEKEHGRTVLVGDLNMNPYEDGMVQHNALHAVPTREIAARSRRTVKFESNRFFYSPMWKHFGESPHGHAGTYYLASPKSHRLLEHLRSGVASS